MRTGLAILVAAVLWWAGEVQGGEAEQGQLRVTLGQVDSLKLDFGLDQLWERLENMLKGIDRPELIRRKGLVTQNYLRMKDIRVELTLLDSIRSNQRAEYELKRALAETAAGGVSDIERFNAHDSYLNSKLTFLAKQQECKNAILEVIQLCLIELTMSEEKDHEQVQEKAGNRSPD